MELVLPGYDGLCVIEKINALNLDIKIIVLGPVTPRVAKIGGKYRGRIVIKCKNDIKFRNMISELLKEFIKDKKQENVSIYADINPESIM